MQASTLVGLAFTLTDLCYAQRTWAVVNHASKAIRAGETAHGAKLLRSAIDSDTKHAGRGILYEVPETLSPSELLHGERQFNQLCKDLPAFASNATSAEFGTLEQWIIRRFAGEHLGFKVDWDKAPPVLSVYGVVAENVAPSGSANACIRIAPAIEVAGEQRELEFEELWHHVAFELLNLSQVSRIRELEEQVIDGKSTRADYVQKMFFFEHESIQLTHAFYVRYFLPWADEAGFRSNPSVWYVEQRGWWDHADNFIDEFPFRSTYPWKVFGDRYDAIRASQSATVPAE